MTKAASLIAALVAALTLAAPAPAATDFRPSGSDTIDRALELKTSTIGTFATAVPYTDPAGDQTGAAGDITTSNVTNDPMGLISFDVDVLNLPTLSPNDFFELLVDADMNPATGDPTALGAEILVQLNGSSTGGGTYAFGRWNGTPGSYAVFDPASEQVSWGSGPLIVVGRGDLGVTNGFNFFEDTVVVSGTTVTGMDLAPNAGSYNYVLTGLAPPPPPPPPPDTTAPNTRIVAGPPASTRSRRATFRFNSTEPRSRFQCRLDGRAWRACASPVRFRNLSVGRHVFRVRAIDLAGNVDRTPAARAWRIRRS